MTKEWTYDPVPLWKFILWVVSMGLIVVPHECYRELPPRAR